MTQHNFNHEIHCATEAHRRGNKPACRHHLLMAIESLDAPQHQYLRDLPLQTKVQGIDAQVWQVIKHEPEVQRVKLRLVTSENHQEWDAPEDTRVEWRATGHCEIWTMRDSCCEPNPEPRPFTWQDAERIMLAGGECESKYPDSSWDECERCRIHEGKRQALVKRVNRWTTDSEHRWDTLDWRPYNPEASK